MATRRGYMVWTKTFMTLTFELKTKFKDNADPLSNDTICVWYEEHVDCGNTNVLSGQAGLV